MNSKVKELDFVELIAICIKNKKIILSSLIVVSILSFFVIFKYTNNISYSEKKLAYINILVNEEFEMNQIKNLLTMPDTTELVNNFISVSTIEKRFYSPYNYENWVNENTELENYFSQASTHSLDISDYNQIAIVYDSKKGFEAIVSYIQHTISKHQYLMNKFVEIKLENALNIRKKDDKIFKKKLKILEDLSMNGISDKQFYYNELVNSYIDIEKNSYIIEALNQQIKYIKNLTNGNASQANNVFVMGKVTTMPVYQDNIKFYQKNPFILFVIIPFIDVVVLLLLILFFRTREEYLLRTRNS